jgi:thioredoxin reductase
MGVIHNVVIVCSGQPGDTAAIYTARADLEPALVEGLAHRGVLALPVAAG